MPKAIITIHGVGQSKSGDVARDVAKACDFSKQSATTIQIKQHQYTEITDERTGNCVIEVNWADILRADSSMAGTLRHLCYIVTSMLDVACTNLHESRILGLTESFLPWYRCALLTLTPGAVLFTIATAIAVCVPDNLIRTLVLVFLVLVSTYIVRWLCLLGEHLQWLWLWVGLVAFTSLIAIPAPIPPEHYLMMLSSDLRGFGFLVVLPLLLLSMLECLIRGLRESRSKSSIVAHLGMVLIPFIAMNGLMTLLSFVWLSLLPQGAAYNAWEAAIWKNTMPRETYALAESAATWIIGGLGILAILLGVIGFVTKRKGFEHNVNLRGRGAQDGIAVFLFVAPIIIVFLVSFWAWLRIEQPMHDIGLFTIPNGGDILSVYKNSVLRIIPWVLWIIGPLSLVLDIIGDVVFYLQPNVNHPAAIAQRCRDRLAAALDYADSEYGKKGYDQVVFAHSQGTVIAADLRASGQLKCSLVTAGSPIDSLYQRFLCKDKSTGSTLVEAASWVNLYRDGDVIGGPISGLGSSNRPFGSGGHSNYWSDSKIKDYLL